MTSTATATAIPSLREKEGLTTSLPNSHTLPPVNTDPVFTTTLATEQTSTKEAEKPVIGSPEGWPALHAEHPLLVFHARLASIIDAAGHDKIWGVTLNPSASEFGTFLVLQKFLRSVSGDLDAAAASLEKTLKWRKEFGLDQDTPVEDFGPDFAGLGHVTHHKTDTGVDVITWNLYGAVIKDLDKTFGDLER